MEKAQIKNLEIGKYVYDNLKSRKSLQRVRLEEETLKVNYEELINTQFKGGNIENDILVNELKESLNLGIYSKAPCGGFVNFFWITGNKGGSYIIFSGVNEVSNSRYIVTLHSIFKIERNFSSSQK